MKRQNDRLTESTSDSGSFFRFLHIRNLIKRYALPGAFLPRAGPFSMGKGSAAIFPDETPRSGRCPGRSERQFLFSSDNILHRRSYGVYWEQIV